MLQFQEKKTGIQTESERASVRWLVASKPVGSQ